MRLMGNQSCVTAGGNNKKRKCFSSSSSNGEVCFLTEEEEVEGPPDHRRRPWNDLRSGTCPGAAACNHLTPPPARREPGRWSRGRPGPAAGSSS